MPSKKTIQAPPPSGPPCLRLADHPFFKDLSAANARALVKAAQIEQFAPDQIIFEEGSPPEALFLVLGGRVVFTKAIPGNERRTISYSDSGDFFGEIGVLTGSPRSLGAIASSAVTLARIPRPELSEFIARTSGPSGQFLQSILHHLHHTTRHYVDDMLKQEKMALVGSVANTIIHDFKNPLTLINLAAELIIQKHPDERTRSLGHNIIRQIERMVEMANEISEFSRGTQTLKLARVELPRLLERFRELNDPYFHRDNVRIEIDVAPVAIEAEENKLLRVLQNLVSNAIDAVEENPHGLVRVRVRELGEKCEIEVSDNGKGIPEEIRGTLFEAFVTFGKKRGTGLGTAIVKSIVEAHHGRIRFETATGQGTSFFITLPTAQGART